IVEGQIDVISMHQHGFVNTVACLGTAITPQHFRKLKQFSDNIILMLDGDSAGQKAALRSIDTLRAGGVSVVVVTLPEGLDPDEFLKKYGTDKLRELLSTGEEGMDYKFRVLASKYNFSSNYEKSKFVHEALLIIKALQNEAEQDIYLKIVHKYTGISIEVLRADLQKVDANAKPFYERENDDEQKQIVKKPLDAYTLADMYLLASIIYQKDYAKVQNYEDLHFEENLQPLYQFVTQCVKDGKEVTLSGVYSYLDVDNSNDEIRATENFVFTTDEAPDLTFESCLLKNKEKYFKKQKQECAKQMEADIPIEQKNEYMDKFFEYTQQIAQINEQLQKISLEYVRRTEEAKKQKDTRKEE
ncbi:MAG: toprim domain-containing protein, partial [Clostridia bacterium]|nr:toprim domain-containing protein [Clostridia bacterium]